ncbi:hypothetical protein O3P69_002148 [Scylla paramamosain]|uniref:Uncharacterized protein n=1 Tax=Scylla paramamosain TaxID=85552 RepID=A0AAW0V516_SCYPA
MEQPLREVLQDPEVVRGLTENPAFFRFPRRPVVAVGAVAWPPHVVMTSVAGGRIVVSGAMGNVLQVLAQTLNFTYNIVIPEDGGWGSRRPNGSWTGMVGQLVRKEADLALGPFGVTVSRAEVIDYTLSFLMGDYTLLSRKGPPEIDPWGFLFPLTETVWAAVAAALVVAWLAATLVARRPRYVNVLGWAGGVFLQHVRVFFNQGITWKAAYGLAGQTVLGSWMVMAAVVFWSYTGNLTSLLAVRHIPQPIQTLRDLLDDPGVTLYISANTLIIDTISRMEDGELREMYDLRNVGRLKYHSLFPVTKMRYGRESSLYTTLTHDMDIASARSVVEAGLYDHWMQQEMPATNCRYAPSVITVQEPLSLSNLWGLFVMLFVMLMVAVAVFCLELCLPPKTKTGPITVSKGGRLHVLHSRRASDRQSYHRPQRELRMVQSLQEVLADPEVLQGLNLNPASFRFPSSPLVVASAVHWPPHIAVTRGTDGVLTLSLAMGNVMQVLTQTLNFTYSVITPEDQSWGSELPNGSWTGMIGQVVEKEADIALGPFGIKLSRSRVVDFTESLYFDDRAILAKKGEPEIDPWGFLYPLTDSVWAALAGGLVVVWLTLGMMSHRPKVATLLDWSIELLLENMRVFLNQDVKDSLLLGSLKVRTVLGSWMVGAAVVYWGYSGNLTSLLAVRHIPQPIQTLRDLIDDPAVTVIMKPNTIVTDTISKMKTGELRELHELQFKGRVKYQHASTFPAALDTVVRHHQHVIISTSLSADLHMAELFIQTGCG